MQTNGDMKPRKYIGARGALMIEVLVTGMMVAVASLGAAAALISGLTLEQRSERTMAEVATAENVMERILAELRLASTHAEDLDRDNDAGDLDSEDSNGNGRIEDDWSLGEGATAQEITFNAVRGAGNYSAPIRFFFDGERVMREFGADTPARATVARDVKALTFTRKGRRVTVHIIVQSGQVGTRENGAELDRTQVSLVREILIRN